MVYQNTKTILKSQGLAPHKKLGQNFLIHRHTAQRIIELSGAGPDDTIIEVGVGLGALSHPLAGQVKQVIGIEADSGLIRWHEKEQDLPANVKLIHRDILKTDFSELAEEAGGHLKVVANLPYSISSPFLFKLIEHHQLMEWAVVMLQKEVALRLMAEPGTKEYGVPTVLLASCATVEPLLKVKQGEFHPRPKVDSQVIRISFFPVPVRLQDIPEFDWILFRKVVNSAFGQRRKTLLNALSSGNFLKNKETMADVISQAGLSPGIRAERLTLRQFVTLTNSIEKAKLHAAA